MEAGREVPERFADDPETKAAYLALPSEVLPEAGLVSRTVVSEQGNTYASECKAQGLVI